MKSLRILVISVLLINFGCSNNSNTALNNNSNTPLGQNGADYFPLTDNALWAGHVTGTAEHLDPNGTVTETEETDADYKASFGLLESRGGRNVFPVFTFDSTGRKTNDGESIGFAGSIDSEAAGFNSDDVDNAAIILPKQLSVGLTWTPAPEALPIECQATLVQRLGVFTNKGGTPYTDVIQVHSVYTDSASRFNQKYTANVDFYFANGVGLVEADIHSFEFLEDDFNGFKHTLANGIAYRKN